MILLPGLKPSGCRALQSVTELLQQPVGHVEANLSSKFAVLFFCRCRFCLSAAFAMTGGDGVAAQLFACSCAPV